MDAARGLYTAMDLAATVALAVAAALAAIMALDSSCFDCSSSFI